VCAQLTQLVSLAVGGEAHAHLATTLTRPGPTPNHSQVVGAQLTQLASLAVVAKQNATGPDGRPVPASELLGGLTALSRLTRLTALTVEADVHSTYTRAGGRHGCGAMAGDVLRALPPGAPLKEVRGGCIRGCLVPVWASHVHAFERVLE
jgi:hypothetical protein